MSECRANMPTRTHKNEKVKTNETGIRKMHPFAVELLYMLGQHIVGSMQMDGKIVCFGVGMWNCEACTGMQLNWLNSLDLWIAIPFCHSVVPFPTSVCTLWCNFLSIFLLLLFFLSAMCIETMIWSMVRLSTAIDCCQPFESTRFLFPNAPNSPLTRP